VIGDQQERSAGAYPVPHDVALMLAESRARQGARHQRREIPGVGDDQHVDPRETLRFEPVGRRPHPIPIVGQQIRKRFVEAPCDMEVRVRFIDGDTGTASRVGRLFDHGLEVGIDGLVLCMHDHAREQAHDEPPTQPIPQGQCVHGKPFCLRRLCYG
jgi:hypothetical protein